jgi:integrase
MARQRRHGERSLATKLHPVPRYSERIQLVRWRRGPNNPTWEARVRLPDGTWTRPFSLRTDDETTAALNAIEELTKREQLHVSGLPQPSRTIKGSTTLPSETFGDVAQVAIEHLTKIQDDTAVRDGRKKAHKHTQHIQRIRNVLLPAFADTPVREISRSSLNDWMRGYRTADGRRVRQNTVGNYNHSFQIVMSFAVERGWIRSDDVPSISKKGFGAGTERPWFTEQEVEALRDHMTNAWVSDQGKQISRENRYLLRAHIAIGSCTGIRPGLEIERIRANQVIFERDRGAPVIRIPIARDQAKYSEGRDVYVFENDVFDIRGVLTDLLDWRTRQESKPDAYLLSRPSDGTIPGFSRLFKQLIEKAGMLFDPETGSERTLYSLRHYFATQALLRGEQDHIVARWMGTSPQMIDRHYSKVKLRMKAAELTGTRDKLARARAATRRHDAEIRNEPVVEQDEYPPDEIEYGSHATGHQGR